MTDLTLPGDIPGLLRVGTVLTDGWVVVSLRSIPLPGSVSGLVIDGALVATGGDSGDEMEWRETGHCSIDLSDPTGRAHAAWWLRVHMHNPAITAREMGLSWQDLLGAIREAEQSHAELDESWIDILRRIVLHVAGREVTRG